MDNHSGSPNKGTYLKIPRKLILQDDGNLVYYDFRDNPIWSSKTQQYYGEIGGW